MSFIERLPQYAHWHICTYLRSIDILQFRATSSALYFITSSEEGDKNIWNTKLSDLVLRYDVPLFSMDECWQSPASWIGLTTYMDLYYWSVRILPFLGLWRWDKGNDGAVLVIRARAGVVLASLISPVYESQYYTKSAVHFTYQTIFRILAMQQRSRLADLQTKKKNSSFVAVSMIEVPSLSQTSYRNRKVTSAAGVLQLSPSSEKNITCSDAIDADQLFLLYHARYRVNSEETKKHAYTEENGRLNFDRLKSPTSTLFPSICSRTNEISRSESKCDIQKFSLVDYIPGLYFAVYGPHGLEMINVTVTKEGCIKAIKATGDINVPSGRCTFESLGMMELPPFELQPCNCGFHCECFSSAERKNLTLLGRVQGKGRTAMTGFVQPIWNDAEILLFHSKTEWSLFSSRDREAARTLESPIRAVAAPVGCAAKTSTNEIGMLVIWKGEGFRTSIRFRPFCP